jgi:hypothetical protein
MVHGGAELQGIASLLITVIATNLSRPPTKRRNWSSCSDRSAGYHSARRMSLKYILIRVELIQTLLAFECRNPIFGGTSNPYASGHTCGGSSGGEAALLALNGSPVGFGSDSESRSSA